MPRIQIFAPHPDDMELFAGGTILEHIAQGDNIQLALMTRGEQGAVRKSKKGERLALIREKEAIELLTNHIPQVDFSWLNFSDQKVTHTPEAIEQVFDKISAHKPDIIYLPESEAELTFYRHSDHLATGLIVENAAHKYITVHKQGIVLRYYHSRQCNISVDISRHFKFTQRCLKYYKSQWGFPLPYQLWFAWGWRYFITRRWGKRYNCRHAEAFREKMIDGLPRAFE